MEAEELRLIFAGRDFISQPDPWEAVADSNVLAACPNLTSLSFVCTKSRGAREGSIWSVITKMASLRDLDVHRYDSSVFQEVPEEAVQYLSNLGRLALAGISLDHSVRIGAPMRILDITSQQRTCSNVEVLSLVICSGMERLRMIVGAGVEFVLTETLRAIPELENLDLTWEWTTPYIDPYPRKILDAVLVAPKLLGLALVSVRIQLHELATILKAVGTRLRYFKTSLCFQDESPLERLTAICQVAADYNLGLRMLDFWDGRHVFYLDDEDPRLRFQRGPVAISILQQLERRAPMLSTRDMVEEIREWMVHDA